MKHTLAIVFVDGLPYSHAPEVGDDAVWRPMRAGFGYSVNAKAELFAGLAPDRVGFFNEFSYDPMGRTPTALRVLGVIDYAPTLSWFTRRVVRRLLGGQIHNIPYAQRNKFFRQGTVAYDPSFGHETVLDSMDLRFLYKDVQTRDRDGEVMDAALRTIGETTDLSIFVALPDLDRTLHESGFGDRFKNRLSSYRSFLATLANEFSNVLVVSDHGMTSVDRLIDVGRPVAQFLRKDDNRAVFLDSTLMRIWGDEVSAERLAQECVDAYGLERLSASERNSHGLSDSRFGDEILVCAEGAVLSPNSYGRVRHFRPGSFAMHGYHPRTSAQIGTIGGYGPLVAGLLEQSHEFSTLQAHALMTQLVAHANLY